MKEHKTKAMEELQILFDKIDELERELETSKHISKSMYNSVSELMVVVEVLSRILVSKNIISKEEMKEKIKELKDEREKVSEQFKKNVENEVYEDYLNYLLNSGSYGNA